MKAPLMYKGFLIRKHNGFFYAKNLSNGIYINPLFSKWINLKEIIDQIKDDNSK